MRTAKILSVLVGAVIAFIVLALLAVRLFVDPNDYKPRIAAAVKNSTGRELALQGDIKLSVFPWIALQLGPASLGNPPGFSDEPFVSFQHAAVRVKLLPLLSRRVEVGRVELDGLDLKLLKNRQGQGNWEGYGRSAAAPPAEARAQTPAKGGGETLQGIDGIAITHARVTYENLTLENVSLETGAFAGRSRVPVTLHVDVVRGPAERAGERGAAGVALADGGSAAGAGIER
ncbi:MAG TPA: AsmA family protein, partial [Steroidobacteraceae bacterium]|nr:AsmA family protein [Steroidobacteraceae bacterium]